MLDPAEKNGSDTREEWDSGIKMQDTGGAREIVTLGRRRLSTQQKGIMCIVLMFP